MHNRPTEEMEDDYSHFAAPPSPHTISPPYVVHLSVLSFRVFASRIIYLQNPIFAPTTPSDIRVLRTLVPVPCLRFVLSST